MQHIKAAAVVAWTLVAAALQGCVTHLETAPDRIATRDPGDAQLGVPYALPMAQYDIKLTRAVSGCPVVSDKPINLVGTDVYVVTGALSFSRKAEATLRYGPGERYTVDYRALEDPFKTTGFTFTQFANGSLKSINANADDQTGEVMKNVVAIGLTTASLVASPASTIGVASSLADVGRMAESQARLASTNLTTMARSASTARGAAAVRLQSRIDAERLRLAEAQKVTNALRDLANRARNTTMVVCRPATVTFLKESAAATQAIKDATPLLKTATADVTRLTVVANLDAADLALAKDLDAALKAQAVQAAAIEAAVETKAEKDGEVAATEGHTWPRAFREPPGVLDLSADSQMKLEGLLTLAGQPILTGAAFRAWFEALPADLQAKFKANADFAGFFDEKGQLKEDPRELQGCHGQGADVLACVKSQVNAFAQFQRAGEGLAPCVHGGDPKDCLSYDASVEPVRTAWFRREGPLGEETVYGRNARDEAPDKGVFVRQPAMGILWICPGEPPPRPPAPDANTPPPPPDLDVEPCRPSQKLYRSDAVSTPQLGQLRYLPFRNGPFEANELALTLREDGSIETFSYKRTRAAGTAAVAAAADAVAQYKTFRDAEEKRKSEALTTARAAQIADIQYQIDFLTKQKELLKLEAPPAAEDPSAAVKAETAQIDAQVALLNAKLAQLKAEAALAEAGGA